MKTITLCMALGLFISFGTNAQNKWTSKTTSQTFQNPPKKLSSSSEDLNWYNKAVAQIENSQYFFLHPERQSYYSAINPKNAMRFDIKAGEYAVYNIPYANDSMAWKATFSLRSIMRNGRQWNPGNNNSVIVKGNHLNIDHKNFEIQYLNLEGGLRQNFIIKNKLKGEGPLCLNIELGGNMKYEMAGDNKLLAYSDFHGSKKIRLIYDSLKVWDATGAQIPAFMKLSNNNVLAIVADDKGATYPLTVDPLNHAPEWTTSADGVLPGLLTGLQLQIDALYGFKVASLGDVNGDGYDDVAIGAPGAIDIIGPTTIVGAGAVFVYFGSASGLSVTPSKVIRANTPVINALFGFSIAAGNVAGDSRNDIIIGAPGESYTATVGGSPSTAVVTAGKVYVVTGEELANPNPSPTLSVYLNGSSFFSRGILGVVGSNISVNALFGFSVSVTEDMNGDGLGEIVVGAPGYSELGLLPVTSGAAFVYYSSSLVGNVPVKLTAPSTALLGIPLLNTGGLLFGFSVDGAGDYNQDGNPDIVVGAPAGITLSGGNLLGGSAYVYFGNGSGVNSSIGTQLKATSSLTGNIANLFGYSVKGLTNAAGKRNGNILIGAPSGGLLSNLVGGLKLKAGNINVFFHQSSPGSSQTPNQQISSPRGNSLLSILSGQNLEVSALFGASLDNMLDVNCDGINDIIVGEPLSTAVGVINGNVVGGAADIFLGNPDGSFQNTPVWTLQNITSMDAGINRPLVLDDIHMC